MTLEYAMNMCSPPHNLDPSSGYMSEGEFYLLNEIIHRAESGEENAPKEPLIYTCGNEYFPVLFLLMLNEMRKGHAINIEFKIIHNQKLYSQLIQLIQAIPNKTVRANAKSYIKCNPILNEKNTDPINILKIMYLPLSNSILQKHIRDHVLRLFYPLISKGDSFSNLRYLLDNYYTAFRHGEIIDHKDNTLHIDNQLDAFKKILVKETRRTKSSFVHFHFGFNKELNLLNFDEKEYRGCKIFHLIVAMICEGAIERDTSANAQDAENKYPNYEFYKCYSIKVCAGLSTIQFTLPDNISIDICKTEIEGCYLFSINQNPPLKSTSEMLEALHKLALAQDNNEDDRYIHKASAPKSFDSNLQSKSSRIQKEIQRVCQSNKTVRIVRKDDNHFFASQNIELRTITPTQMKKRKS